MKEGERAVVTGIKGGILFKNYLRTNGISDGTVFSLNYSPAYAGLVQITVAGKMISLRIEDFKKIEYDRI